MPVIVICMCCRSWLIIDQKGDMSAAPTGLEFGTIMNHFARKLKQLVLHNFKANRFQCTLSACGCTQLYIPNYLHKYCMYWLLVHFLSFVPSVLTCVYMFLPSYVYICTWHSLLLIDIQHCYFAASIAIKRDWNIWLFIVYNCLKVAFTLHAYTSTKGA